MTFEHTTEERKWARWLAGGRALWSEGNVNAKTLRQNRAVLIQVTGETWKIDKIYIFKKINPRYNLYQICININTEDYISIKKKYGSFLFSFLQHSFGKYFKAMLTGNTLQRTQ